MTSGRDESGDRRTDVAHDPASHDLSTLEIARQIARDTMAADHKAVELNTQVVQII